MQWLGCCRQLLIEEYPHNCCFALPILILVMSNEMTNPLLFPKTPWFLIVECNFYQKSNWYIFKRNVFIVCLRQPNLKVFCLASLLNKSQPIHWFCLLRCQEIQPQSPDVLLSKQNKRHCSLQSSKYTIMLRVCVTSTDLRVQVLDLIICAKEISLTKCSRSCKLKIAAIFSWLCLVLTSSMLNFASTLFEQCHNLKRQVTFRFTNPKGFPKTTQKTNCLMCKKKISL